MNVGKTTIRNNEIRNNAPVPPGTRRIFKSSIRWRHFLSQEEQGESFNPPSNEGIFSLRRPGTGRIIQSSIQWRHFVSQEARNRGNFSFLLLLMKVLSLSGSYEQGKPLNPTPNEGLFSGRPGRGRTFQSSSQWRHFLSQGARNRGRTWKSSSNEGIFSFRRPCTGRTCKSSSNEGIFSFRRPGTGRIFQSSFQWRHFLSQEARNKENLEILLPIKVFSLSGGQEQGGPLNPSSNEGIFYFRRPGTGRTFKSFLNEEFSLFRRPVTGVTFKSSFQWRNFLSSGG